MDDLSSLFLVAVENDEILKVMSSGLKIKGCCMTLREWIFLLIYFFPNIEILKFCCMVVSAGQQNGGGGAQ